MKVENLIINDVQVLTDDLKIDWTRVYNVPTVNITSNNHNHDDRYYRKAAVNSRIASLVDSINGLIEKVDLLNETKGILLSSSDAFLSVPKANTDFSTAFTISLGIIQALNDSDNTKGNSGIIFNKESSYELAIGVNGYLFYALHDPDSSISWYWIYTGVKVPLNERHKVTFIYDGTIPEVKIYLDGGLVYNSSVNGTFTISSGSTDGSSKSTTVYSLPSSLAITSDNLMFGDRPGNSQHLTNGEFDTIKIYNRALIDSEVIQILSTQENDIKVTNGLVSYYNFEGADPLNDKSGNGVNATVNGTVSYPIL